MGALRSVLVRSGGILAVTACSLGIHSYETARSDAFRWCLRCGRTATTGWRWVSSVHYPSGFSIVSYERGAA